MSSKIHGFVLLTNLEEKELTFDQANEYQYETDKVCVPLYMIPYGGATLSTHGVYLDQDEYMKCLFYIPPNIHSDRNITLTFNFLGSGIAKTYDGELTIKQYLTDGSSDETFVENCLNFDYTTTDATGRCAETYTFSSSDIVAGTINDIIFQNKEATITIVSSVQADYYIRRG